MTKNKQNLEKTSQLVLISGVSGAGKSSELKALEDIGFEAIDNVPISLLGRLVGPGEYPAKLAIGVDIRTRDFNADTVVEKINSLVSEYGAIISILFLDCSDEILLRRFEETRRRHPLAIDRPVSDGLRNERHLIKKLKNKADMILDTSDMTTTDLKLVINSHYSSARQKGLSVFITSFGFRNGLPRNADLVWDVRFLKNPHYCLDLRSLDGKNPKIGKFIRSDNSFDSFFQKLTDLLDFLLERYAEEGKNYVTIAFGCTGGRHRSVFLAETLAKWFKSKNQVALVKHRDVEKFFD